MICRPTYRLNVGYRPIIAGESIQEKATDSTTYSFLCYQKNESLTDGKNFELC